MQLVDNVVYTGREILEAEKLESSFDSNEFLQIVDNIVDTAKYVSNKSSGKY
jgi:hypothetical protein